MVLTLQISNIGRMQEMIGYTLFTVVEGSSQIVTMRNIGNCNVMCTQKNTLF